jgi:hypothetical protein
MIKIKMGRNNMSHVFGMEAKRLDLADRGLMLVKADVQHHTPRQGNPRPRKLVRMGHILKAVARINEHQPVRIGLDQQTVTNDTTEQSEASSVKKSAPERTVGPAIQMVNLHSPTPS